MSNDRKRKRTQTSNFGSAGREGHNSSSFYNSKLYYQLPTEKKLQYSETPLNSSLKNKLFCQSSELMDQLPDNSIHLTVTSPPYNVGKIYDENLTLKDYLAFLNKVWREIHRVLVLGGRFCLNIANLGRKPYIPLHSFIIKDLLDIGFLMRGEVVWDKSASAGTSTAWGSWQSASNPTLRDIHEYILIFSKENFKRPKIQGRENSISREEFLEYTKSIWRFPAVSAKKTGHPAPFPVELPYRCIQFYTYTNDIVLDPFMGSGQTAIATLKTNRFYVGYDVSEEYIQLAENRIKDFKRKNSLQTLEKFI
jgi:DNA modification methylase